MQIHELNNFTGTLGSGAYLAIDDGTDTGKISSQGLLAATEARIDNIIAGPAPSAEEIVDARLGADGVTYPSLGDAIRDQFTDVKSDLSDETSARILLAGRVTTAESDIDTLETHKVAQPLDGNNQPTNGTSGQLLRTKGNGSTEWTDVGLPTDEQTAQAVSDWLDEHPEATTTVEDGSITSQKLHRSLKKSIDSDGLKKMWSIQTNSNSSGTFYQMGISLDGISSALVEGTESFLDDAPTNLGSDWLHFQYEDYHIFTITFVSTTADFYIAITKDFKNWVHKSGSIGFRNEGGYTNPYVWTPQIFEFNDKLYMAATVQEGAPVSNGSRYQTMSRFSGIYVAEISLDYETADVTKLSSFTRISFEEVTDKKGNTYDISGNAMDAWFVPFGDKLVCVFNDRYLLEIHTAIADSIGDTFEILAQNIFKMPCTEAPTVLQINEKLWQVCGCYYGHATIAKECNIRCVTSDFEHFYEYVFIRRIDVEAGNTQYTGRMRNPSFFYMTDEQEHDFCIEHPVKACGYQHVFEPQKIRMNYTIVDMFNYTDVAVPANTEFDVTTAAVSLPEFNIPDIYGCDAHIRIINSHTEKRNITYNGKTYGIVPNQYLDIDTKSGSATVLGVLPVESGTNVITPDSSSYSITDVYAQNRNDAIFLNAAIGSVALTAGANTLGTLNDKYKPRKTVFTDAYLGAGSGMGVPVRISISSSGVVQAFVSANQNSATLRFSCVY